MKVNLMAIFFMPVLLHSQNLRRFSVTASVDLPVLFAKKYTVDLEKSYYSNGGTNPWRLGASLNFDYHMKNIFIGIGFQRLHIETKTKSIDYIHVTRKSFYANITQRAFPLRVGYAYKINEKHRINLVMNASVINPQHGYYDVDFNYPDTTIVFKPAIPVQLVFGFDLAYNYALNDRISLAFTGMFRYLKQDEFLGNKTTYLPDAANVNGKYGGLGLGLVYAFGNSK